MNDKPDTKPTLEKLFLVNPTSIDGSTQTLLQASSGYQISIRPELQGCVVAKPAGEIYWVPFANCKNGTFKRPEKADK
jgi:hypothetical protein